MNIFEIQDYRSAVSVKVKINTWYYKSYKKNKIKVVKHQPLLAYLFSNKNKE